MPTGLQVLYTCFLKIIGCFVLKLLDTYFISALSNYSTLQPPRFKYNISKWRKVFLVSGPNHPT